MITGLTFDFDAEGRITARHDVAGPDKLRAVTDGTPYDDGTR
ncbi:hypothetical protein [Streptomyces sp. NRRL S-340]|nr:hypothetical protein [Streptomyces sp. NRRL S-340]